jgi:hypothetical protein
MSVVTRFVRNVDDVLAVRVQDCEPIIDRNKRLQNEPQDKKSIWRHVASIPNVILESWLAEEWRRGNVNLKLFSAEFDRIIERKLRDSDWRWLRVD